MISTFCLNPSFDKTVEVSAFRTGGTNRILRSRVDPGGKGVNVARVLKTLGMDVRCVCALPDKGKEEFLELLSEENLEVEAISTPGTLRTNTKIFSQDSSRVTELNESGVPLSSKALEDLARSLNRDLVSHAAGIPGKETMATTFTALLLDDTGAWHVHTGNTRLAVMSGMFIRQITTDHTTWQWLMDSGNFEAADRCNRCEIQSCLGAGSIRYLTRLSIRHFREPGSASGVYILTSDGIHEYTDADFMEDVMGRPEISDLERTDLIMEEALKNESPDDKTILIVRC